MENQTVKVKLPIGDCSFYEVTVEGCPLSPDDIKVAHIKTPNGFPLNCSHKTAAETFYNNEIFHALQIRRLRRMSV